MEATGSRWGAQSFDNFATRPSALETRRILPDFAVLSKQKLDEEVTGRALLELDNTSIVDSQEPELAFIRLIATRIMGLQNRAARFDRAEQSLRHPTVRHRRREITDHLVPDFRLHSRMRFVVCNYFHVMLAQGDEEQDTFARRLIIREMRAELPMRQLPRIRMLHVHRHQPQPDRHPVA
jgi:hypothetical protein